MTTTNIITIFNIICIAIISTTANLNYFLSSYYFIYLSI